MFIPSLCSPPGLGPKSDRMVPRSGHWNRLPPRGSGASTADGLAAAATGAGAAGCGAGAAGGGGGDVGTCAGVAAGAGAACATRAGVAGRVGTFGTGWAAGDGAGADT